MSKTYTARPADIVRQWYVVDAKGKTLGRLATKIASVLKGKHKVIYTPHMDVGDHVIVINAKDVVLTGNKREKKVYYRHTGYPGGLKKVTAAEMLEKNPERVLQQLSGVCFPTIGWAERCSESSRFMQDPSIHIRRSNRKS